MLAANARRRRAERTADPDDEPLRVLRRLAAVADAQRVVLLNVVVAALLSLAAVALARPLFATQSPSFRPLNEVAFNAPLPRDGTGPVLSAAVLTNGCDPWVAVEIVAQGPAEYWATVGAVGRETPLAFTVLGSEVRDLAVGVAEVGDPLVGSHILSSTEPVVRRGEARNLDGAPVDPERPDQGASAGVVIRNWAANRAPIKATFEAKWMDPIGFRRCALHIPPLVGLGLDDAYGAGDGFLRVNVRGYQSRLGTNDFDFASFARVEILGADVNRAASSPPPRLAAENVFYACRADPLPTRRATPGRARPLAQAQTRTLADIESDARPNTCEALVEIRDSNHDSSFNLQLLLVGALMSLAAAAVLAVLGHIVGTPRRPDATVVAEQEGRRRAEVALEEARAHSLAVEQRLAHLEGEVTAGPVRAWRVARALRRAGRRAH